MYPVNKTVPFTTSEVKSFVSTSEVVGEGVRTISFDRLIKGDDLIDDFVEIQNDRISQLRQNALGNSIESIADNIDRYLEAHDESVGENNIPSHRIKYGMSSGLIDLNTEALILTESGWETHDGKVVASKDAGLHEIERVASRYAEIVTTISHSHLEVFDRKGKVVLNGKVVAERVKSNAYSDEWFMHESGRTLIGNAERVLHHQNEPFYLLENAAKFSESLYHGSLHKSDELDDVTLRSPLQETHGASSPGVGIYMAGLNEVVKVYANGISLERQSLKEFVVKNTDPNYSHDDRQGVVFKAELSNGLSIYNADYNSGSSVYTSVAKPSPYVFLAVINADKSLDRKDWVKYRAISELSCAENHFEVYRAIERLSVELDDSGKTGSIVIPKVFASMGYNSVRVAPPSKEQISMMRKLSNDIAGNMEGYIDDIKDRCDGNPKSLLESFRNYSQFLLNGVSGRIDNNHVIVFGDRNSVQFSVDFTDKIVLPKNDYFKSKSYDDLINDPLFYSDNGKNYDDWSLKQLSRYISKVNEKTIERGEGLDR